MNMILAVLQHLSSIMKLSRLERNERWLVSLIKYNI
uniref:Uncharacterized protein n=1 Tax=Anguilla anguilla TaxID=7936 RepID=A0A0E9Q7F9_ANGAN